MIERKKFVKKNDPFLDKHRRQEKANAYLRYIRKIARNRRNKYDVHFQMDDTTNDVDHNIDSTMYGTTKDDADAGQTQNIIVEESDMTAIMTPVMTSGYTQPMIKDFLSKPVAIDSFDFTPSSGLFREYAPHRYLHKGVLANDIWWSKLAGFYGIKGTFIIRVNVNGQPFQAGRLIVTHEPMYYDMVHSDGTSSAFDRISSPMLYTQLPRVELDVPTQTEMKLDVPYRSLTSFYNLQDGTGTWGRIILQEYIGLNVAGTAQDTVNCIVFLSLENVELSAASLPNTIVDFQVDVEKKPGPFEKGMALTNKVAMIGSTIPYIKTVAKPLAWVSSIGEKVCSIFGWSKPLNTTEIQRFNNTLMQYQSNNSGLDNAFNLGLSIDNEIECDPTFGGTFMDESSFGYIKTRSAWFNTWPWQGSLPTGSLIGGTLNESSILLCPNKFTLDFGSNEEHLTPIAGLANVFSGWRGGLRFKFKFAKTPYHSGRLAVSFYPSNLNTVVGADTVPFDVPFDDTSFLHREILDIREAFEFEFTVPYTANVPFLPIDQPMGRLVIHVATPLIGNDLVADDIDFVVEVSGAEDLEFFGPKTPVWFPKSQDLLPIISGTFEDDMDNDVITGFEIISISGSDQTVKAAFRLAQPSALYDTTTFTRISGTDFTFEVGDQFINLNSATIPATTDPTANLANAGVYQYDTTGRLLIYQDSVGRYYVQNIVGTSALTFQADVNIRKERMIGATSAAGPIDTLNAAKCVGEQILSAKQLALRTVYNTPVGTELLTGGDIVQNIVQRPHGIFQNRQTGTELGFQDYYSYVASFFAFVRGGTILRYQVNSFKRAQIVFDDSKAIIDPFFEQDNGFEGYVVEKSGNIVAVYVPQYGHTIGRLVTRTLGNDLGVGKPYGQTSRVIFDTINNTGPIDSANVRIGRSAADDTQFGFFIGIPPMSRFVSKTPV